MDICSRLTIFEEKDLKWPQQPLTEKYQRYRKIRGFCQYIQQKRICGAYFDKRGIKYNKVNQCFEEKGILRPLRPRRLLRLQRLVRSMELLRSENHSRYQSEAVFCSFSRLRKHFRPFHFCPISFCKSWKFDLIFRI